MVIGCRPHTIIFSPWPLPTWTRASLWYREKRNSSQNTQCLHWMRPHFSCAQHICQVTLNISRSPIDCEWPIYSSQMSVYDTPTCNSPPRLSYNLHPQRGHLVLKFYGDINVDKFLNYILAIRLQHEFLYFSAILTPHFLTLLILGIYRYKRTKKYYEMLLVYTETPHNTARKIANQYVEVRYHHSTLQKKIPITFEQGRRLWSRRTRWNFEWVQRGFTIQRDYTWPSG